MNYKIDNNSLVIGDHSVEFKDQIEKVLEFENILVVLTKRFESAKENVYGVDGSARIVWQVPKIDELVYKGEKFAGITFPYSRITKMDDKRVKLHNWDGTFFEIDASNGALCTNPVESRIGRRPW